MSSNCTKTLHKPRVEMSRSTKLATIFPMSDADHSATVIFLHGLGDTSSGWTDSMYQVATQLPHVKFLLPTAPSKPVTLNMGMRMPSWYDIKSLTSRENDTAEGIEESRQYVVSLINKEVEAGIPASRIVVGGFSQGGALSLYTGYQMTENRLAGVCVLSGYIPNYQNFQVTPLCQSLPSIICHGSEDQVVRLQWAEMSKKKLQDEGVRAIDWHIYPGMEHSACMEEIDTVTAWLKRILPCKATAETK